MGARVPCLLLLALIVGTADCANARCIGDGKQDSAVSRSKDVKPPRPGDKPGCVPRTACANPRTPTANVM